MKALLVTALLAAGVVSSVQGALTWTNGTAVPGSGIQMHGSAIVNNRLYIVGGNGSFGTGPAGDRDLIEYADITGPGTIGTWTTATGKLPGHPDNAASPSYAYIENSTVAYNGRIYVVSGDNNGAEATRSSVTIIKPEANGDVLQSGITVQAFTAGIIDRFSPACVINQATGKLYVCGGGPTAGPATTVNVAQIDPVTGAVGAFSTTSNLVTAVNFTGAEILGNKLYVLVGYRGSGAGGSGTMSQYATINGDGTLGAFALTTGQYPEDRFDGASDVVNGKLYYSGGAFGGNTSTRKDTNVATISGTGDITAWVADVAIPTAAVGLRRITSTSNGGTMYIPGGRIDGTQFDTTTYIGRDLAGIADWSLLD